LHFDEETNMKSRIIALAAAALAGCATFSPDGGFDAVQSFARPRIKQEIPRLATENDRERAAALVKERLAAPLTAEDAVAIALLNNPSLLAAYAELGVAEAELVQAGRLRNPGFSFARLRRGEEREIERKFVFDVIGLVTMPLRLDAERGAFAAAQLRTARDVVGIADEARRAWTDAVAAAEISRYAEQVRDAAQASAELADQMKRAGNFSRLAQSREQLFFEDAKSQLARARLAALAARERLARSLGLTGGERAFSLPERLPDIPAAPRELRDAEGVAMANRLDVQAAKRETEALARSLGLTRVTGFVNVLHLGYRHDTSTEMPRRTGYEIEVELPLFDWGTARVARAEALYRQALNLAAAAAIRARSEVREGYASYRTAHELAKHYCDEVVPLRKLISEENLLRYNGMLISVFELLADSREQAAAVMAAIEATRDFWIADANLEMALMTGSPASDPQMKASTSAAAAAGAGH
jgi:outer membrane protein TolC